MARFTHALTKLTLLGSAAALGVAFATPAAGDGPCIPRFTDRQHLLDVTTPAYAEWLQVGDLDGDGWSDVMVARLVWKTTDAYEISILLNDPESGLRDGTLEMFDGPVTKTIHPKAPLFEDFNGDGRLDAFIADTGKDDHPWPMAQNLLILSTPEGKLRDATDTLPQQLDFTHSAAAADIDGDGDVDIWVGNDFVGPPPYFLINDGTGTFVADHSRVPDRITDMGYNMFSGVSLVDVNADGSPDLLLGQGNDDRRWSYVLLNDGRGYFDPLKTPFPFSPLSPRDVTIGFDAADLDGDGNVDFLKHHATNTWAGGRDIQLLFGNGDGTFRDETDARLEQDRANAWMRWAMFVDLNRDGALDIVGWPLNNPKLFYLNDGEGRFVEWDFPYHISEFAILDIDRDGKLDILGVWAALDGDTTEDYGYHRYLGCSQPHCRVYEHDNFGGDMYPVFPGTSPSTVDRIGVSSMQADPGCVLTLTFGDASVNETGRYEGASDWIGDMLNDRATSAICECR